ncbi:MAG: hypothetical protein QMD85_00410 [Candidatus Aenigmarchaeota archaeon]|nr:hypothetical protein [Candidatus Aenigmarchaeota archaeon]MDI6721979.1 hypothetical protein [Candidatus Aenigmarchaeota archaeon]
MLAIKQMQRFTHIKELEAFLEQHPNAEIISTEHYSVHRDTTYILSVGNKKIQAVPRPRERLYQVPVIYCVYEKEGGIRKPENAAARIKTFGFQSKMDEINTFLSSHYVIRIAILPFLELTGHMDNYLPGEYGPVPDRQRMYAKTHQILVIYKK